MTSERAPAAQPRASKAWAESRAFVRSWQGVALLSILLLATVLRVAWVAYAAREPQGLHDPSLYYFYGAHIADARGYRVPDFEEAAKLAPEEVRRLLEEDSKLLANRQPTAYYPVGYPAALGGVYSLVRHTPIPDNLVLATGYFQVFLSVATAAFAFFVGRRLFSPAVGLLAAFALAVWPNLVFNTSSFLTETLFNFLVMLALLVILSTSWQDRRLSISRLLVFGVVLGLSALVRPISLLFVPLLVVAWLGGGFGWRRAFGYAGLVAGVTAAVIAPWAIRNAVVMDAPIVISANLGDDLCIGHYPGATGHFGLPETCFAEAPYEGLDRATFEVRRNNDNIRRAIEYAVDHPTFELKILSRKAYYTWEHDHDGLWAAESYGEDPFLNSDARDGLWRLSDVFYYTMISLGALGLAGFVWPPLDARRVFFLLALLALAGVPLAFFGDARFHVPVLPLLAVAAAWVVVVTPLTLQRLGAPKEASVQAQRRQP